MDTQQMLMMLPDLQPEELVLIQNITKEMSEDQQKQFYMIFKSKRKDRRDLMILTLIGFFGVAGLQRFVIGEIGMGLLFLFTLGFCGIGTIIDLIHLDTLCSRYNQKQVLESANLVKMMQQY